MNDEIKEDVSDLMELLETTSKKEFYRLTIDHELVVRLYNYITILQQDNEMYAQLKDEYEEEIKDLQQENERLKQTQYVWSYDLDIQLEDYKSRCEKAIDKLGNYKHYSTPTEEQNRENEDIVDSAFNILQNGSDSQ